MVDRRRERVLNVRIDEDEERMAKALAEDQGLSVSDIIRQFIRRAFIERWPSSKKTRAPR